jgi:hypothetical protein
MRRREKKRKERIVTILWVEGQMVRQATEKDSQQEQHQNLVAPEEPHHTATGLRKILTRRSWCGDSRRFVLWLAIHKSIVLT